MKRAIIASVAVVGVLPTASADQFTNFDVKVDNRPALELLDADVPGADKFMFYCWPVTWCNGERYKTNTGGQQEVTFNYGNRSTIQYWPEGNGYRFKHINGKTGQVSEQLLKLNDKAKPTPIPNVSLFQPNWGPTGTRVKVNGERVEYCYDKEPCSSGTLTTVGDRLAIAELHVGALSIGTLMLGRAWPNDAGKQQYSVVFHRHDGQSFLSPFVVE